MHIQSRALQGQFTRGLRLLQRELLVVQPLGRTLRKTLESKRSTALIQTRGGSAPLQQQPALTLGPFIGADASKNLQSCIRSLAGNQRLGVGEDHLKAAGVLIEVEKG